jgi:MFS family permease
MHSSKKSKFFYGYWILVAAFFCVFVYSAMPWYAFSLFVKPLEADFGWSRGEIMVAFTIAYLVIGMASPVVGRMIDRYGAKGVISVGALIAGLGFVLLSLMNNLWFFYGCYIIVGVGIAALGIVPASAIVSNWFEKKRGTAIGIMSTGIGVGGFAIAPLTGGYLLPNFGWSASYLALAILTWVLIIPLTLLIVKTKPADMGLYPDGTEAPEVVVVSDAPPSAVPGLTLKAALATLSFWLIAASFLLSMVSLNGVMINQVPYLEDIGFPATIAATALGTVGITSAIAKLGFGWLCDRIPAKYAYSIGLGLQLASIIILMTVRPASPQAIIWLYAVIMGLAIGSWMPSMSMLISTTFGLTSYGAIFGMITLFQLIGTATGPVVAGYMYDAMNTYQWAFFTFLALTAVAIPAILAVRRPKSR